MDDVDPVIRVQARLRIVTILDTLGAGDALPFPRLQALLSAISAALATHLRNSRNRAMSSSRR